MPKSPAKTASPKRASAAPASATANAAPAKTATAKAARGPRVTTTTVAKATKVMVKEATRVSEADRRRAEELLARIARRKGRIGEDFYDIGEALRELAKRELYRALGYSSFNEMLTARNVMSRAQAHKLISLVSRIPREKALAVGSEKAALLVRYADATPEPDTPEWLLEKGTLPSGKPVTEASTRELTEAATKARARAKKKKNPEAAQAERGAREVQATLRKLGAKGATAEAVRRAGEDWLRIEMPAAAAKTILR